VRGQWVLLAGVALVVVLALGGSTARLAEYVRHAETLHGSPALGPEARRAMTLTEARETVDAYAQRWQSGAEIGFLCSVDDAEDSPSSGLDGRRRAWQATIVDPTRPGAGLYVDLVDGSIAGETEGPGAEAAVTLAGQLVLDSPEALALALEARPDFTPALPGGKGVHFCLERSDTGVLAITVRGGRGSEPAMVSVDGTTGAVLAARHQTFGLGGILHSSDGGQTWSGSELPGVPRLAADPLVEDEAYAATTQDSRISV
jgi:hypothetical protein